MKRIFLIILVIILVVAGVAAYLIFGSGTAFSEKSKMVYIDNTSKEAAIKKLSDNYIISNKNVFSLLAGQLDLWEKLKPGKFEFKKGQSTLDIVRMLRNNKQAEIKLVINKLRIKEDLAKLVSKNFAADSASVYDFLISNDSLKQFDVDTNTVFTLIIPDTYNFYYTTPFKKMLQTFKESSDKFWKENNRTQKAENLNYTPKQIYALASIVEEETNHDAEKGNIASVYMNRIDTNMRLGADPTIKFALKDFTLTRIYHKHLNVESPYNTYRNGGVPPGPICTPTGKTIDAVLNAPKTDYYYFVASDKFDGTHTFASTYEQHLAYAKEYQQKLDEYQKRNQQK